MTSTVASVVARAVADAGIDRVFGLPGGEVLVLIDELRRAGVDFVLMRHEANAGIAAAVYGKLRRQPGVVLTTLGPGAANLMLPLSNAYLDQEPLLAISAQIPGRISGAATRINCCRCTTCIARSRVTSSKITGDERRGRRAARAGRVHGAAVRRRVSDAVGTRGAEAGAAGSTPRDAAHENARSTSRVPSTDAIAPPTRPARSCVGLRTASAAAGRDRPRHRYVERAADPPMGRRVESAGRRHAEGQGDRRRNVVELRRRHQRHGGRRPDVRRAGGGGSV